MKDDNKMVIFGRASESDVTKAIITEFAKNMEKHIVSDVIVIGGGPSGLMAARELARRDVKVLVVVNQKEYFH